MALNPIFGSASLPERTHPQSLVFKALAKRIAARTRCGLPGIIREFDPVKQYATVQLAPTENLINELGKIEPTAIPELKDVLVLFPGDANWCLTFPSLVNAECYVCFADMCINAWATNGWKGKNAQGGWIPQDQEAKRRHDLSDGFAILAPRSQPNRITSFSTTAVELRSLDNGTKVGLVNTGDIVLQGSGKLTINGTMGSIVPHIAEKAFVPAGNLEVSLNGVTYYIQVSTTP